jgi:putative GTP pyrophosphokinase
MARAQDVEMSSTSSISKEGSRTLTVEDRNRITEEYQKHGNRNQALLEEVVFILRQRIQSSGIKIHDIEHRIKKISSVLDKCERKGSQDHNEMADVVGVRIVCLFRSDMSRVSELLMTNLDVISVDDKLSTDGPMGYQSTHYICQMPAQYKGPRYENTADVRFEIQVRTLCMHAWAAVSHHLDYKGDWDVPDELKRALSALSGLFYVADNEFEQFYAARLQSKESLKTEARPLKNREINLDTMTLYLAGRFPDREQSNEGQVSEIVQEVKAAGYTSIVELDRDISKAALAFSELEKANPPTNGRYITVGVVRISLRLVSKKFRQIEQSGVFGNRTKYDEGYKAVAHLITEN